MPSSRHQKPTPATETTSPTPPITTETPTFATEAEINSFGKYLHSSKRILVLCGAGLSAASGIPTFSGDGAHWRGHKCASISSIDCFEELPGLVWKYHAERRKLALAAKPNKAHEALAVLARKKAGVRVLTQNIDGLSQKAKHPRDKLYELHGSLLDIKCSNKECDYYDKDNFKEPVCSALAVEDAIVHFAPNAKKPATKSASTEDVTTKLSALTVKDDKEKKDKSSEEAAPRYEARPNPLADIIASLSPIMTDEMRAEPVPETKDLPHCPQCSSLLRPAVVWFGESLSVPQYNEIIAWIDEERKLDLMIVIGTRGEVFPAGKFVDIAKEKGARVCVINMDKNHLGTLTPRKKKDWVFQGNAAEILPVLFEGILLN